MAKRKRKGRTTGPHRPGTLAERTAGLAEVSKLPILPSLRKTPSMARMRLMESGCVLLAIALASAFFLAWLDVPILHDAAGYVRAGQDIRANGLFSKYVLSDIRTYGWPLVVSWLLRLADAIGAPIRAVAFGFEFLFHLFACYAFRYAIRRTSLPPLLASLLWASLVLNPLILIYSTYLLTESISFSLLILLLADSVYITTAVGHKRLYLAISLGSLVLGASIMVRPSNICMAPVWWCAAATALWISKPGALKGLTGALLTLVLTFVPMIPQYLNNLRYYQRATPLLANNFGMAGVWLGIRLIKYAGCYIPGVNPQVMYENPFLGPEPLSAVAPLTWYTEHPGKGLATIGLHIFNLLDQDMPFPYSTSLLPGYYPWAALANMLIVSLGIIGLVLAGRYVWRHNWEGLPIYAIGVATLICQLGMQALWSVEARYGIPMLMVLYMFAGWLLAFELPRVSTRTRFILLMLAASSTAAACPLSLWVRQQAPSIRAAIQHRAGMAEVPAIMRSSNAGGRFLSGELTDWTTVDAGVGPGGEAILCARTPGSISALFHRVALEESTTYVVEFEARAPAGVTSELVVSLYDGAGYDQPSLFSSFDDKYARYKAEWNTGHSAPSQALLRFVTVSTIPVQIRNVVFHKAVHP